MTRLTAILAAAMCAGACTSSGTPVPASTPLPADMTQADNPDSAATEATQNAEESPIEVVDLPAIEQAEMSVETQDTDDRICRREIRTGTHRAVRVCRTRAEIERMSQKGKDTFRDMHETQRQSDRAQQVRRQ